MSGGEMLQLSFHFGERDRFADGPLEAAVVDACARRGVAAAVTLRGVEGFGAKQRLRTDRLLSLSEDAPLVVIAVGQRERIEALTVEVEEMAGEGLIALEPVVTATTSAGGVAMPVGADEERVKATVWGPRRGPRSPHLAAVDAFRRHGADSATVLLGVDGVLGGERRRARFVAGNRGVPAITVATGGRDTIEAALADLDPIPPLVTLEPVESCSRIARASHHARVALVTSEIARHGSRPRYLALIHALREEGAAGATALRGVWGFRGAHDPHGDRVLALRRDVPIVVEAVDTVERSERWREIASGFAGEGDVVESRPVPGVVTLDRVQKG